jgi:alanyl-tRNA synthetase
LTVDVDGFEAEMEVQRDRARAASKFGSVDSSGIKTDLETEFSGYDGIDGSSIVAAIYQENKLIDALKAGEEGVILLESTPFYAESGGQVGDTGVIESKQGLFAVTDTQKSGKANIHFGKIESGAISVGDSVSTRVDGERRRSIMLNHSATHLMHAALREILGDHIAQKGSLVAPDRLRFDFLHFEAVSQDQLQQVEDLVNEQIRKNVVAETKLMQYDDAVSSGAVALFGEKYADEVRVFHLGDFSVELCGGTHVGSTGDIGVFKITSEGGVASGVRRVEAVTGAGAMRWIDQNQRSLDEVAGLLRSPRDQAGQRVELLLKRNKELEKQLAAAKQQLISGESSDAMSDVTEIDGIKLMVARMDGADAKTLRDAVDRFKDKLGNAVVVLGSVEDNKVRLAVGVTRNSTDRVRAGDIVQAVAEQVGGKGGGRPDFAQAGGSRPEDLDAALASVDGWMREQLDLKA